MGRNTNLSGIAQAWILRAGKARALTGTTVHKVSRQGKFHKAMAGGGLQLCEGPDS